MRAETYYMLSFDSTHAAMSAEQYLRNHVPVCVMPTLRAVSASCGISLRVEQNDIQVLLLALGAGYPASATPYHLYQVEKDGPQLKKSSN